MEHKKTDSIFEKLKDLRSEVLGTNSTLSKLSEEELMVTINFTRDFLWLESFKNILLQCPSEVLFKVVRDALGEDDKDEEEKNKETV